MSTTQLTEAQMRALHDERLDAYNRHDIAALLEHLTDDVVWTEPTREPAHGKQAVAAALKDTFTAFPDVQFLGDGIKVYPDVEDQSTVSTWSIIGTMTGSTANGAPATGRSLQMSGATLTRFRDGLISEYAIYYDSLAMLQQLGLLPETNALGFKAIVLADVVAVKTRKVLQRH